MQAGAAGKPRHSGQEMFCCSIHPAHTHPAQGVAKLLRPEPAAGQAQLPWAVRGEGTGGPRRLGVQRAHLWPPSPTSASTQIYVLNHFRFHNILQVIYTTAFLLAEGFMQLTGICFLYSSST